MALALSRLISTGGGKGDATLKNLMPGDLRDSHLQPRSRAIHACEMHSPAGVPSCRLPRCLATACCRPLGVLLFASVFTKTMFTLQQSPNSSVTVARGKEQLCYSASPRESADLVSFLAARSRTTSSCSQLSTTSELSTTSDEQEHAPMVLGSPIDDIDMSTPDMPTPETPCSPPPLKRTTRVRFISECDSTPSSIAGSCTLTEVRLQNRTHHWCLLQPPTLCYKAGRC